MRRHFPSSRARRRRKINEQTFKLADLLLAGPRRLRQAQDPATGSGTSSTCKTCSPLYTAARMEGTSQDNFRQVYPFRCLRPLSESGFQDFQDIS